MQTLSSRYGNIDSVDLAAMTEYAHTSQLGGYLNSFPSQEKVSQCEELIEHVYFKGHAYVCWGVPGCFRVGLLKKFNFPVRRENMHEFAAELFFPVIEVVENDILPISMHMMPSDTPPERLPLLFVPFVLVTSLQTPLAPNNKLTAYFTSKFNKIRRFSLETL